MITGLIGWYNNLFRIYSDVTWFCCVKKGIKAHRIATTTDTSKIRTIGAPSILLVSLLKNSFATRSIVQLAAI